VTSFGGRVAAFLALGVVTGGVVGAVLSDDRNITTLTLYVLPGLVFGLVFGPLLTWCEATSARGAAYFAIAATGANAAAVFTAIRLFDTVKETLHLDEPWALAVVGVVAGAIGGGLLALVVMLIADARRAPWLTAAGALLGALLPIFFEWEAGGAFVFYALWQAGYAAAMAMVLPPMIEVPGP